MIVSLLTELDAFSTEHMRCGDLDGGVDGDIVWFTCTCGTSIARRIDDDNHARGRLSRPA